VENRRPTRAEATDVANAVWEGTDAVMLSEETSIGKFPSNAVKAMALIASEAEKRMPILPSRQVEGKRALFQTIVMSQAAHLLADRLKAKAIVAPTRSGQTALYISKERPDAQILAPTTDEVIARRMSLYWGVRPMIMPKFDSVDELLKLAKTMALKSAYIKKGDTIVITSGAHGRRSETASLLEVRQVGV